MVLNPQVVLLPFYLYVLGDWCDMENTTTRSQGRWKPTCRVSVHGRTGCALHKGIHPEVNETQNLAPTLPSQVCALVQGCVSLKKCVFSSFSHKCSRGWQGFRGGGRLYRERTGAKL